MTVQQLRLVVEAEDLDAAVAFYRDTLGCRERTDTSGGQFCVLNFYGAQLVLIEAPDHVDPSPDDPGAEPYKHFGLIMDWDDWHQLVTDLRNKDVPFRIQPNIKDHQGIGKVGNLFLTDPAGNYLEFKSYQDPSKIY